MIPEILIIIGEAIYYVVEIVQLIMASEIWEDFVKWYKERRS